jgi:hypothetical protein
MPWEGAVSKGWAGEFLLRFDSGSRLPAVTLSTATTATGTATAATESTAAATGTLLHGFSLH